jgi:hypothetical protein
MKELIMVLQNKIIEMLRKIVPEQIAKEICDVQPINIDFEKLRNDPLINLMLNNFFERLKK